MFLENIVFDALDPRRVGLFWEEALGCERLTDTDAGFETRLVVPHGPTLDLCFPRVPDLPEGPLRLHLDLAGDRQRETVCRLRDIGATDLDIGQGDVPWVVLADPEGAAFCVLPPREGYRDSGPIAALRLESGDPRRDVGLWAWLTGWVPAHGVEGYSLRHVSGNGPFLEIHPEQSASCHKNRIHLDVRLETDDDPDAVAAEVAARGGRELHPDWGVLPWRVFADPSGNEFCILPASPEQ